MYRENAFDRVAGRLMWAVVLLVAAYAAWAMAYYWRRSPAVLGGEPGPLAGTLLSERAGDVLVVTAASLVATTLLVSLAAHGRASAVSRTTGRFRAAVLGILSAHSELGFTTSR